MFKRNALGNTRTKIVAGAVLLAIGLTAAGSAMSTDVFGGGATLPAGAYVGFGFNSSVTTPALKLSSSTASNNLAPGQSVAGVQTDSFFGAWAALSSPANGVSYCQTGSGNGKKIFDHTDGASLTLTANDVCTGLIQDPTTLATNGFGAVTTVDPHFAGSDAPMSQAEYGWFFSPGNKAATYTQPVQFPAVVGSVAIVLNNSNPSIGAVNLTDSQLCGVFSGQITTWSGLGLPADPVAGNNLSVVYRSDGSGTTFSLANHLAAVCGGVDPNPHFVTDQAFTVVASKFLSSLPGAFKPANGNAEVIRIANATAGSIAYAEAANLKHAIALDPTIKLTHATVNGLDPFTNLSAPITVTTVANSGITGVDTAGRPVVGTLSPVSTTGCMNVVNPTSYATSTTRYPIVAVSYLIGNMTGNGSDTAAVKSLFNFLYTHAGVNTVGPGTGYAFVSAPLTAPKVNSCINS